ncbi:tyrosine-protein kinase receptor torso-like [Dermacentor albipictus]|uniref:tyrosine-protein kinase receptor torso-like n=1 Tax=Dermacentor albipictus TaxID=60249 RepID=UPI0038FCB839
MRGLSFDTNYTVVLRSTDTTEKLAGGAVTVWFKTPSCLDCYQFNFSLCAPGPPSELKVLEVQRPSSTWVAPPSRGLRIAWSPPAYASEENRVLGYQVTIEEERSIFDIQEKPTRRIRRTVGAETQQLSVSEILDGALYRVLVQAESPAGLGQPAITKYSRQAGYSTVLLWSLGTCVVFVAVAAATASRYVVHQRRRPPKAISQWELGSSPAAAKKSADSELEFLQLRRSAFRLLHRSWDTYEIPFETLELHEEIGRGAFSVVHRAHVWVGKLRETVAVKMLKDLPTSDERRDLRREIELLKLVGKHANVVSMRAYCTMGPRLALVVEYCPLGDLRTYLIRTRARLGKGEGTSGGGHFAHENGSDSADVGLFSISTTSTDSGIPEDLGEVPSLLHLLSLARQVAQGMEFLSSKRVVHRDLAARNVLLVTEHHAKIADLGLSRDMYEEGLYRKQGAGRLPARWMALESLSHMTFSTMSDVWSFGVLLWEVASLGATPYPGVANHQLLDLLTTGHRLEKPASCPQETYDLMTSCWNAIPICRPTFSAIVSKLDEILEQSQGYFNFNTESE